VYIERERYRDFAALYEALLSSGKLALQAQLDMLGRDCMGFWIGKIRQF